MLLRVPEDIHRRLVARAAREGRSLNAVATQILDAAIDADQGNRRERLRAKAGAAGMTQAGAGPKISKARRKRILQSTRGLGPRADRLISVERDRF